MKWFRIVNLNGEVKDKQFISLNRRFTMVNRAAITGNGMGFFLFHIYKLV